MAIRRVRVGVIFYSIQMTKTVVIKSPTIFIDYLLACLCSQLNQSISDSLVGC
jgi:hypothetical protein